MASQSAVDPMTQPRSAAIAIGLLRGLVLAGLVVTVLVVIFQQDLGEAWSAGEPADSAIEPLHFVPVVVVLYVVVGGLALTLVSFLSGANEWALHALAAVVLIIAITTVAGIRTNPPALFLGVSVVALVYLAVTLVFLYRPETIRWVRARAQSDRL